MAEVGCPGDPAALCAPQFAYWRRPPLRPGTREFLASVDLPICVVSDADRADLSAAIAFHGLAFTASGRARRWVRTSRTGRCSAMRWLRCRLGRMKVVHVGDSLTTDIRGADAAGIRAVWVNRGGRARPAGAPVAYEIGDLTGLAEILR